MRWSYHGFLCVVLCLNSFWGDGLYCEEDVNEGQRACLSGLVKEVRRFSNVNAVIPEMSWHDLFAVRSIDYKGDEVRVAKTFSWHNVAPALPNDVGNVPLEAVCELGCRDYVLNFDHYLRPKSEWVIFCRPESDGEGH